MLFILFAGNTDEKTWYLLMAIIFQIAWVIITNYLAASASWLDKTGSHTPLLAASQGTGIIIGPVIAGFISTEGYTPVMSM